MLKIGLTGGVASGKSTVAALFAAHGAPIIDTDLIARELVAPGQPALAEIADRFGPDALNSDGSLDRPWLRRRIFADDGARRQLEDILHPRIRAEVRRRLEALRQTSIAATGRPHPAPYAIVVIPLLVETGAYDEILDRVLVVDVPEALQLERLMTRDGMDEALARAMLDAQASRPARLARADDVIDNSGAPEALVPQVERLHRLYSGLV
ncbi:MAG: dephospho-CoA kinase [Pseudomonadota bacterium]